MNTKEAIQAMLEGKKVVPVDDEWQLDGFMVFSDKEGFIDGYGTTYDISDFIDDVWTIYEEPKPKKTIGIEKWLVEDRFGITSVVELHHHDIACYCHEYQMKDIKLLSTYEVVL